MFGTSEPKPWTCNLYLQSNWERLKSSRSQDDEGMDVCESGSEFILLG